MDCPKRLIFETKLALMLKLLSIRASYISHGTTLIIYHFDNFSFIFNADLRSNLLKKLNSIFSVRKQSGDNKLFLLTKFSASFGSLKVII